MATKHKVYSVVAIKNSFSSAVQLVSSLFCFICQDSTFKKKYSHSLFVWDKFLLGLLVLQQHVIKRFLNSALFPIDLLVLLLLP